MVFSIILLYRNTFVQYVLMANVKEYFFYWVLFSRILDWMVMTNLEYVVYSREISIAVKV